MVMAPFEEHLQRLHARPFVRLASVIALGEVVHPGVDVVVGDVDRIATFVLPAEPVDRSIR